MNKRVTVKDISNELGVSMTTVTKALNNLPRISEEVRKKVVDKAKEMGYTPNHSAKALARNEIRIGIVYPEEPVDFYRYVRMAFDRALDDLLDYRVTGIIKPVKSTSSSEEMKEVLLELEKEELNGIILSPGVNFEEYQSEVERIIHSGTKVLCLINDVLHDRNIPCVRSNHTIVGRMAAQVMSMDLHEKRDIVVLTSNKNILAQKITLEAFEEYARKYGLNIKGIFETQDDKEIAYYLTDKVLKTFPDIGGIYVSSYNSVAVCSKLEELGADQNVFVIGHDLYPSLVEKIFAGTLNATIFQNQYDQAKKAVMSMFEHFTSHRLLQDILVTPQLIISSNVECYESEY